MLFNSYEFLFLFLPVVLGVTAILNRVRARWTTPWLALASLAFYAAWNVRYLPLLLASAAFNYLVGLAIARASPSAAKRALVAGIAVDLGLLGVFKYLGFFAAVGAQALSLPPPAVAITLPLGISFFTFTQVAFLVDVHRRSTRGSGVVDYLLFVSYFPHLIAGPILHHRQMVPQFTRPGAFRADRLTLAKGLTVFAFGLFKKVVIADDWSPQADAVFAAAALGQPPLLVDAWTGALAYTIQLYFDFSGYCDMAIGLSLLFAVRLPQNFDSPYKATSVIEFWQRWHLTLSRFLRDYLYIPLGGNRRGAVRRHANLMATMVLGGLWHGAAWTFVLWGALHGAYLAVNHGWRAWRRRRGATAPGRLRSLAAGASTFVAVVVAWVVFRADGLAQARAVLAGMAGLNGLPARGGDWALLTDVQPHEWLIFVVLWGLPNLGQLFHAQGGIALAPERPTPATRWQWRPSTAWAAATGAMLFVSLAKLNADGASAFLYFQF